MSNFNTSSVWPALVPLSYRNDPRTQIVSASGVELTFANGTSALCGTSGLWNVNLGYGNKRVADAVHEAMLRASYASLFRYWSTQIEEAAERLRVVAGSDHYARVLFTTSGGSANDAVMKLARQFALLEGNSHRKTVVGLKGSYHGLTYGAHSLSGDDLAQPLYGIDTRNVRHIGPNSLEDLERLFEVSGDRIAAVVIEPVLGSGALELDSQYIDRICQLRDRHEFVLVADEVATGFGRTGRMFASDSWQSPPDVLIVSKGLTNGTQAAAAVIVSDRITRRFVGTENLFVHAETQAGTPVVGAAVAATLDEFDRLSAIKLGRELGERLEVELLRLGQEFSLVQAVRGVGCFRAVGLVDRDGSPLRDQRILAEIRDSIRAAGATVHPGPDGFQILPALVYSDSEVDRLFKAIRHGLEGYEDGVIV